MRQEVQTVKGNLEAEQKSAEEWKIFALGYKYAHEELGWGREGKERNERLQ